MGMGLLPKKMSVLHSDGEKEKKGKALRQVFHLVTCVLGILHQPFDLNAKKGDFKKEAED